MTLIERWNALPATVREPVKSFVVACALGGFVAIGTLWGAYFADHSALTISAWGGFFLYLLTPHSIGAITAAIVAMYRVHQGLQKAKAAPTQ